MIFNFFPFLRNRVGGEQALGVGFILSRDVTAQFLAFFKTGLFFARDKAKDNLEV